MWQNVFPAINAHCRRFSGRLPGKKREERTQHEQATPGPHPTELLESRLDGELIALGNLAAEETDEKKRASYIGALMRVRDYRVAHPRKTNSPEIDQSVADVLASSIGETRKWPCHRNKPRSVAFALRISAVRT
jgi:hypothetical protein